VLTIFGYQAAQDNNKEATLYLAAVNLIGNLTSVPHNITQAHDLFARMAALGSAEAQHVRASHSTVVHSSLLWFLWLLLRCFLSPRASSICECIDALFAAHGAHVQYGPWSQFQPSQSTFVRTWPRLLGTYLFEQAVLYHTFASLGGHVGSHMALGYRYLKGIGVEKSCESALLYYRKAADIVQLDVDRTGGTLVERRRLHETPKTDKTAIV
jgi:TPR repeat protein